MMESQFSPALVGEHLGILARRNIDGVVLFGFTGITEEMLTPWRESMVLLARDAPGFASVCYDDNGAVNMLMQRLYDGGHRHISFLGYRIATSLPGSAAIRPTSILRAAPVDPVCRPAGTGHETGL